MAAKSVIPFGPQHPVLPEPIHLDLVMEDEHVVEAIPSIGFVHRGLEKLVEKKDFQEMVYVAERICGICSLGHGLGYCDAVEHLMDLEIPERAKFLRVIWSEMSRIHSHLLWLGLLADAFGFESLHMQAWRIREQVLDMFEESTGGRVIFSVMKIGGQRRDVPQDMLKSFLERFERMEEEVKVIARTFMDDAAVQSRLKGIGVLSADQAEALGCTGPFLRASGVARDIRSTGYSAYGDVHVEPITGTVGDSYARCDVRIREIFQSFEIIREAVGKIPEGPVEVPVKGFPSGEYMTRIEQPRGEALYYVKANGKKFIERMRVRTPTFANLPGLVEMLKGCELADVPILILTIDPCISCTER
ncbi:MAG: nickel-dependent hydrogenase large subunit [Lachnospiraceae bacterium]|nr:nickel-dependent hydrogenase large subunit [Lachnospiraceae bacterium]